MKQMFVSAVVSLISGICFALGVAGVIFIASNWEKDGGLMAEAPEYVRLPPEVRILEHAHVPGTPSFTIRGVIENTGATEWAGASIEAVIKAGGAQMNKCDTQIDGKFLPKSRRAFQIECYGVAGSNVPENISYELAVRYARKRPG